MLVTRDKGFLQLHREEHPHSGIIYWPHGRSTKPRDMQELLLVLLRQIVSRRYRRRLRSGPDRRRFAASNRGNASPFGGRAEQRWRRDFLPVSSCVERSSGRTVTKRMCC